MMWHGDRLYSGNCCHCTMNRFVLCTQSMAGHLHRIIHLKSLLMRERKIEYCTFIFAENILIYSEHLHLNVFFLCAISNWISQLESTSNVAYLHWFMSKPHNRTRSTSPIWRIARPYRHFYRFENSVEFNLISNVFFSCFFIHWNFNGSRHSNKKKLTSVSFSCVCNEFLCLWNFC